MMDINQITNKITEALNKYVIDGADFTDLSISFELQEDNKVRCNVDFKIEK